MGGGDDSDDDDYVDNLRREVGEEMAKLKRSLTCHEELTCNIRVMCGFMMETRSSLPQAGKIISEAKLALEKSEKDEQAIEKLVSDWQNKNKKWIRGKKKKKGERGKKKKKKKKKK